MENGYGSDDDAPGPSAKRQKTLFPRGTVKEVKVHNFMTYADTTIKPGARLNLVLGPNGTGKSSLVCALCVGLGGKTTLLGRADNLKDYIRRGQKESWVEITLSGGDNSRDYVIRRDMKLSGRDAEGKEKCDSHWKINGREKTLKDVQELVKSLNIQFDNLCQFLPQDKVVEFARLDPYELLIATQKAIGDASLFNMHQELIAKRNTVKQSIINRDGVQRQQEKLVAENARIDAEYRRYKRRNKLEIKLKTIKEKLVWADVDDKQAQAKSSQEMLQRAKEALEKHRNAATQDMGPVRQLERDAKAKHLSFTQTQQQLRTADAQLTRMSSKHQELLEQMEEQHKAMMDLDQKSKRRGDEIRALEEVVKKLQADLEKEPAQAAEAAQLPGIGQQLRDLRDQLFQKGTDVEDVERQLRDVQRRIAQLEQRQQQLNNVRHQRLQRLAHKHRGVREVYEYVQRNPGVFRQPVTGPLLLDINMRAPEHAPVLEQQCGWMMAHFVCSTKEDQATLSKFTRDNRLGVTAVYSDPSKAAGEIQYPDGAAAQYQQYGILGTLDQMFDAPALVKTIMCDMARIHTTYIGNQHTSDCIERVKAETRMKTVFTHDTCYSIVQSEYSGDKNFSTKQKFTFATLLQGGNEDDQGQQQVQNELTAARQMAAQYQQQHTSLQHERVQLEGEIGQLERERDEINGKIQRLAVRKRSIQSTISAKQQLLERLRASPDPLAQKPAMLQQLQQLGGRVSELAQQMGGAAQALLSLLQQCTVLELEHKEMEMQLSAMKTASEERERKVRQAEQRLKQAEQVHKHDFDVYKRAEADAKRDHPITAALKEKFEALPEGKDELNALYETTREEADAIVCNNANVANEYHQRERQISELGEELKVKNAELEALQKEIDELHSKWQPELMSIVEKIDATFGRNFGQIGCAGEVKLDIPEDYDKAAIKIMVKFRESEPLQQLTANRQSGGERSVSTILYLIALQDVTVTPFRVVDEINQGMDPINERKVFVQLVASSCQEGTPQCFLLTPKLLPDLPFTPDITVLEIFNGTQIEAVVARNCGVESFYGARLQQEVC